MPEAPEVVLIPTAQVRVRYGNVSEMWIERRLAEPDFPRPIYIGKRRFFRLTELEAYERSRTVKAARDSQPEAA